MAEKPQTAIGRLRRGETPKPRSFRTVHQCLMALGARREDVYIGWKDFTKYRSIYGRYEKWELEYMAKRLHREAIKKYHPDRHSGEERYVYDFVTSEVNHAFQRITRILSHR